jgi:ABC-type branched-subunit amino acid transport system substrate-binding protein/predicted negative regulator of RcsB-dependent stress response
MIKPHSKKMALWMALPFLLLLLAEVGNAQSTAPASRGEQAVFDRANQFIKKGQLTEGIQTLESFLVKYPKSPVFATVLIQLGEVLAQQGDLKKAEESFLAFLKKFPEEPRIHTTRYSLSQIYLRMGKVQEALAIWDEVAGQEELKLPLYNRAVEIYTEQEDYYKVLHVLTQKLKWVANSPEETLTTEAILAIIRNRLSEANLHKVVSYFSSKYPADEALIRLIYIYDEQESYYREEKEISRFVSLFPNHPYAEEAQNAAKAIQTKLKKNRYLIAAVLPLSGKLASFGESALQGIQLALKQFKEALPGAPVGLVVRDDDPSPQAQKDLKDWLYDYKPLGIVGPLLSKDVSRVAPLAEKGGWALITPGASSSSLPFMGETVFRNATTPYSQCHQLTEYAVQTLNLERFAIFSPSDASGEKWKGCLSQEVTQMGGEVVITKTYASDAADFNEQIKELTKRHEKKIGEKGGFDALFLPGEARGVGLIIPQLVFHNLKDVLILGTMGWNDPEFLRLVGPYADGAVFIDGFFLESPDPLIQGFVRRYKEQFQTNPDIFAAQAYDAVRLILESMKQGALTRTEVKATIANTKDFPGVSGYIYEIKNGEAIKKPFLIQVKKGRLVQIN